MGPVSVIGFLASLSFLVVLAAKLYTLRKDPEFEEYDWGLKLGVAVCAVVFLASVVGVVDAYLPMETPFDPPSADSLREAPREVPEPEPLELEPKDFRPHYEEVRQDHSEQLDAFERRALPQR